MGPSTAEVPTGFGEVCTKDTLFINTGVHLTCSAEHVPHALLQKGCTMPVLANMPYALPPILETE